MFGCVATACKRLSTAPCNMHVTDGTTWRLAGWVMDRVTRGYVGKVQVRQQRGVTADASPPICSCTTPESAQGYVVGWPGVGARRKRSSWRAAWTSRAARARGELELTGEPTSSCIHQIGRAGKASTFFAEAGVI